MMNTLFPSRRPPSHPRDHSHIPFLRASDRSASPDLRRIVKLACWGLGLLCLAYVGWVMVDAAVYQSHSREVLKHVEKHTTHRSALGKITPAAPSFRLADLDIPRVGLSVMVSEGTDDETLRLGAGHLAGNGLPGKPGNAVIAGHRDTFFRSLRKIKVGDVIDLTSPEGTYRVHVDWTRVVPPTDREALDPTSTAELTLVTCYPFSYIGSAPERFVVRASLLGKAGDRSTDHADEADSKRTRTLALQ